MNENDDISVVCLLIDGCLTAQATIPGKRCTVSYDGNDHCANNCESNEIEDALRRAAVMEYRRQTNGAVMPA